MTVQFTKRVVLAILHVPQVDDCERRVLLFDRATWSTVLLVAAWFLKNIHRIQVNSSVQT